MTDTQTVGNGTETVAQPAAEVTTAQDNGSDLSALLNEFTEGTKPSPQPEPQKPATTEVVDTEARRELAALKFERDIKPVIKTVRGDVPEEVFDDDEIQGWLDSRARKDPRLQKAWDNRASNPAAWNKVEKALSAEFARKFQKSPDPHATEDVAAVTAAVRGASTTPPPDKPINFAAMTNSEGRRTVKEKYGFDPGW